MLVVCKTRNEERIVFDNGVEDGPSVFVSCLYNVG